MNDILKVFKTHLYDPEKTTYGNGVFELNLKNPDEKHHVFSHAFIDFLFKALNSFVYTSFSHRRPFKEICYLWNSYGTLVSKLDALLAYSLLSLECLGNFHSIVPFNTSISIIACLLADGMTRDVQKTVELLQDPVTGVMARRMEEEHQGKIAIFEKMIQDLAWQVIGAQEGALGRS
ncbi:hypothetical protein M9H77_34574 [Catharanthus roseus]|uniref:Uncharacterized protein n=1 Tax=Catharanthus roseus TaxID=4058 RepID=A0ACB9ZN97_CATRO|nr:hypothetical protein M9H77_34574 [Catharanthus roseus]